MEITEPLIPPSLNKTLVPLPNHVIGLSWFDFKNCDNSSRLLGMKKVSAGPPTFHDVCLDNGSLKRDRSLIFLVISLTYNP